MDDPLAVQVSATFDDADGEDDERDSDFDIQDEDDEEDSDTASSIDEDEARALRDDAGNLESTLEPSQKQTAILDLLTLDKITALRKHFQRRTLAR